MRSFDNTSPFKDEEILLTSHLVSMKFGDFQKHMAFDIFLLTVTVKKKVVTFPWHKQSVTANSRDEIL